jgi:hypothetical protein
MPADTDAFPAAFREHMDPLVSQKQFVTNEKRQQEHGSPQ